MARAGFWIVATAIILLDQWTKHLVQQHLPLNGISIPVLPGVWLTHVHNTGVAFGQLSNAGPVLIVMAAFAVACIVAYRHRVLRAEGEIHHLLDLGLALPLGGAIGNMVDRIRLGKVVDFVDFGWWPVFNVADTAITLGAVALLWYFMFVHRPETSSLREMSPEMAQVRD